MIEFQNVVKTFPATKQSAAVHAVQDVSLKVETGEIFGVIGYSGAGKSTLIRLINGLEQPTAGQVIVDRQTVNSLGKKDLLKLRQSIGMIFQSYNLLTTATVYQNIVLPLKLIGLKHTVIAERAEKYLKIVGLWNRRGSFPAQLSGGQRQRVAIARALAYEPKILLSDEATSALDPETTESILKLLLKINRELGITIFLITHELDVIQRVCDRVAVMEAGHVVEQGTVVDIFTQPKQAMTKQFVGNNETLGVPADILAPYRQTKQLVLLQFVGDTANTPALAAVASRFKVEPNILAGSMGYLKRSAYGRLLVYLKTDQPEQYRDALAYLQTAGIYVEEVQ